MGKGLNWVVPLLLIAVLLGTATSIIATESEISARTASAIGAIESIIYPIFVIEYLLRLWVAPELNHQVSTFKARIGFILSPMGVIDLIVILTSTVSLVPLNIAGLRIIRIFGLLRIAKFARLTGAFNLISRAFIARKYELLVSFLITFIALLLSATLLYIIEGNVQPKVFGSIPRSLWWATVTLTTIGYGDVYPITALGKFVGAMVSIIGIGIIAIPTGIFAAAISEELRKN